MPANAPRYTVALATRGNPDFGQNPRRPLPGVLDEVRPVASLAEASAMCRAWIASHEIGGGAWTGGKVIDCASGKTVAQVSYNGRTWKPGKYPQPEISDADLASVTP